MITRIEAYRYRCFSQLGIALGPYNVLAGANGAGKTTLLDIPTLLGDLLAQRQQISAGFLETQPSRGAPRAHTLAELIHQGRGQDFALVIEAQIPAGVTREIIAASSDALKEDERLWPSHLRYEVRLSIFNDTDLHIDQEYLYLFPEVHRPEPDSGLRGEPVRESSKPRARLRLEHRSWRSIVHRDSGDPARFTPEIAAMGRPLDYHVPSNQLALASVPYDRKNYPAATWLRDLLQTGTVFYDPDWRGLRRACPPGLPKRVLPTGVNLPWLALALKKDAPERYQDWVDHVGTALGQVETIDAREREEDHHAYMVISYRGGYQVTSSGLSDGTLRILALTILPYLVQPPAILVLEEPENGIHPRAVEAVLASLTSLYDGQVWLSTHSPVVLAHTKLAQVLCARLADDGAVVVIPGDQHPRLRDWQGGLDLGSLFAAGVLG